MQFDLTGRDAEIAALARQVAKDVLQPQAAATDAGQFPVQNLRALGSTGLLGIKIRKEYGGLQAGNVAYVAAIRELAGVCASTAVTVAVTNMVADMIQLYGSDDQRQRHLPQLTSGTYLAGAFALSETGAGSDAAALRLLRSQVVRCARAWNL
jgi:alkylation response protein AidB-like acyl-CoA dehydrogenase